MGFEDRHRHTGLNRERLVVLELLQSRDDRVEAFPVAGSFTDTAIDDQVFHPLGVLEVVLGRRERAAARVLAVIDAAPRAHSSSTFRLGDRAAYS